MSRKNKKTSWSANKIIGILILVVIGGIYYFTSWIPSRAVALFGEPDTALKELQRLEYSRGVYEGQRYLLSPLEPVGSQVLFTVESGETVGSVAARLQQQGLIASSDAFLNYLIYKGMDRSLRSGEYYLSPAMTPVEIAEKIHSSASDRQEFGSIAGWRVEEVAASLESYGFSFTADDFLDAVRHPDRVNGIPTTYQSFVSLEGFLFPGSYQVDRTIQPQDLVSEMVNRFDQSITGKMKKGYQKNGLSLYQAVVLASIVEKEAILDEEKPVIASVFYNRLATGMNLESDPSVQYALGYNKKMRTWWTNPLNLEDLGINSPYNTYRQNGLPPTPICSPGIASLKAVAFPADTGYYYFRAACDNSGSHVFAATLDEQIQNACP